MAPVYVFKCHTWVQENFMTLLVANDKKLFEKKLRLNDLKYIPIIVQLFICKPKLLYMALWHIGTAIWVLGGRLEL